jgi:hypothetical protein
MLPDFLRLKRQIAAIEDDRVELKADWPDAEKAARRVAGHANASGGGSVLWIIGLDEQRGARNNLPAWTRSFCSRRCTWLPNQRGFRYWREADIVRSSRSGHESRLPSRDAGAGPILPRAEVNRAGHAAGQD